MKNEMINQKSKIVKKRYNLKRIYLAVIIMILIFAAITFFVTYNFITHKPEVEHDIPFVTEKINPDAILDNNADDEPDNSTIINGVNYKRRDDVYNFLIAGESVQTDVMMIINYDVGNQKVSIVQIPRDMYINVGRNFHKLNSYYTGEYNRSSGNGMKESEKRETAMTGLASMLEQNLNIKIDYWALVDLAAFRNIVEIIGGVEVNVPHDIFYEDPDQNLTIDLKAGTQWLDGDKAEQFVRFREGYALQDKGRMDAQKIFMTAFIKQIKASLNVNTVTKIVKQVLDNVTASITAQNTAYFATEIFKVDFDNISMMTLPVTSVYNPNTRAWYEVMNRNDTLNMINQYINIYDKDITDAIFDINRAFTNESQKYINDTYRAEHGTTPDGKTATEIDENSIHIPINK